MIYLIVKPCMFTFEYTHKYKSCKKTTLCDFAYALCEKEKLLKQQGFPIRNSLSHNESTILLQSTGISDGIINARGKTLYECIVILLDLLRIPKLNQAIIVEYDKFYSLLLNHQSSSIIFRQLINELNKIKVVNLDEKELPKKTNIAISDCLAIYNQIIKN